MSYRVGDRGSPLLISELQHRAIALRSQASITIVLASGRPLQIEAQMCIAILEEELSSSFGLRLGITVVAVGLSVCLDMTKHLPAPRLVMGFGVGKFRGRDVVA